MGSWRETGDSRELMTGTPLAQSERWLKDREADLDVDEVRFIKASARRRDDQENHYRTLYGRALLSGAKDSHGLARLRHWPYPRAMRLRQAGRRRHRTDDGPPGL
jgi:hypothetical protein